MKSNYNGSGANGGGNSNYNGPATLTCGGTTLSHPWPPFADPTNVLYR